MNLNKKKINYENEESKRNFYVLTLENFLFDSFLFL